MGANSFDEMEIDAIGEIMNISFGASATAVSTILGTKVNITTPVVNVLTGQEFEFKNLEPAVGVEIAYIEGLAGSNVMMFSRDDVRVIVGMLMGSEIPKEEFELNEINRSAICEVMNQMMGSSATALSEFLGMTVNISTPASFSISSESSFKEKYFPSDACRVVVHFSLEIEGKLKSEFLNIMTEDLAKRLLLPFESGFFKVQEQPADEERVMSSVPVVPYIQDNSMNNEEEKAAAQPVYSPVKQETASVQEAEIPSPAPYMQPAMDPMVAQIFNQMQQSQMQMMEIMREIKEKEMPRIKQTVIHPSNPPHREDEREERQEEKANQELLMKLPLEVSVEIGRTKKLVKDILEFTQGSLVVLDKMAGEQADLYVNGQCIARGDIVVVEDNFGIRITEIVTKNLNQESL